MHDVTIIGSGCAGWTAAIYAARANLKPVLITGIQPGGLLTTTTIVENFPGFSQGIDGNALMMEMQEQAKRFGTDVRFLTKVTSVNFQQSPFRITLDDATEIESRSVIIATGARHRHLGVPGEVRLENRGVTYCATCDGALPLFRDKPLVVVGGGDTACEEATYLTRFGSLVYLVHRRDTLRASRIMAERTLQNPKIRPIWNSVVEDVLGDSLVSGVRLRSTLDESVSELPCAGVFVAIGHVPNTELFAGQIDLHENGYVRIHDGSRTNVPGVFVAGDCADFVYRQAVTAAGMGCMAAIDAERYLAAIPAA